MNLRIDYKDFTQYEKELIKRKQETGRDCKVDLRNTKLGLRDAPKNKQISTR